jgi:integrase/recombinase XerC/integrase/recombinase XerD
MNSDQLSLLNPTKFFGSPLLDHRCFFEGRQFLKQSDLKSVHPIPPLEMPTIRIPSRRQILDGLLDRIGKSTVPGKEEFEEYLLHKYRQNCRINTLKGAAISLSQFLAFYGSTGSLELGQIKKQDIGAFIEHLQDRGLKPNTVNCRLRAAYAFIRFLVEKKMLGYEILERKIKVKLPDRLPRAIDPVELKQLLSVIDNTRDRALILLLLRTGMRIGELLSTTVSDVDFKEKKVLIYQADKTAVGRVVYYSEDAKDALSAWMKIRNSICDHLFFGRGHRPLGYEAARTAFRKHINRAGLEHSGYTLHCLRHTFATDLLNAGMRLECLQVLLGHTNLEITRRYARLTDKTREEEYFSAMRRIEKGELDADD